MAHGSPLFVARTLHGRRVVAFAACAMLALAMAAGLRTARGGSAGAPATRVTASASAAQHPERPLAPTHFLAPFAAVRLLDQHGRTFDARGLAGHTVLFSFVFTGCASVCPVQTQVLADVRAALPPDVRDDLRLVSMTIDPFNDTPAAMAAFAARFGLDDAGWTFVTGAPRDIDALSAALRLRPDGDRRDLHATSVWLVDREGRLLMRYHGDPPDAARLTRELVALHALKNPR